MMSGIADTDVLDVVAEDADGACLLVMVETRPWGSDPDQLRQLREKINTYAGAVLDGTVAGRFPQTARGQVRIQLDCVEPPRDEFSLVVDHAADQLRELGVDFRTNVRS